MKRILLRILAVLAALILLAGVAGVLILRSDRFFNYVRQRIVEVAENATGARVEMQAFSFDWTRMRARVDGFVMHGTEPEGDPPLVSLDSVELGLRIVSILERSVDLQSLTVARPQVHVVVFPDGSTNFPGPAARREDADWSGQLLNLKIGRYEITDGVVEYDNQRAPLNLRGDNLRVVMNYDSAAPSYNGNLGTDWRMILPGYAPFDARIETDFALERDRVSFARMEVSSGQTSATLAGTLEDFRGPHGTLTIQANAAVADGVRIFDLPVDPSGVVLLDGALDLNFAQAAGPDARQDPRWGLNGRLVARGLRFERDRLRIENATVTGQAQISSTGFSLRDMNTVLLGAPVSGRLSLDGWRVLHAEGDVSGLSVHDAAATMTDRAVAWNGTLAGNWSVDATLGQPTLIARATLTIDPAAEGPSIEGHTDLVYDQAAGTLELGSSAIATAVTRLELEGTLGRNLRVRLRTTDLNDLAPAIAIANPDAPDELPVKLNNGSAALDGNVSGPLNDPHFQGQIAVANAEIQGYSVEQLTADADVTLRQILARNLTVRRRGAEMTGSAALTARPGSANGGFSDGEMTAQLRVTNIGLAEVAREAGWSAELAGTASADVRISGSVSLPEFNVAADVRGPAAFGESFDRVRATFRYLPGALDVLNGIVTDGASEISFRGRYQHAQSDWRSGDIEFSAVTQNFPVTRFERIAQLRPALTSTFNGSLNGAGRLADGAFALTTATVDLSAREITLAGEPVGDVTITAETRGRDLTMNGGGFIRGVLIEASGAWRLEGDAPGMATVRFARIATDTAAGLAMIGAPADAPRILPFEGFIEGGATIDIALQKPTEFRANATLNTVQVNPRADQTLRLGVRAEDATLRNDRPVIVEITRSQARIQQAGFVGRDTRMTLAGIIPFESAAGADLSVNGNINLVILQLLNPNLLAEGNAAIQASIRGSLQDPNVNGRLELRNASLYLNDVPYGVDNVAGSILFDRTRATIESLTAETGGGTITFTGFLGFGSDLVYRVQARASNVRVRYPQDVSTTFDADLALNGTAEASTATGTVTLRRSAINAQADITQLLSRITQSSPATASPNEYLQGMRLDIRVVSGPAFQFETSLASDLEASADLRVRGSAVRPILLGTISIDRGEAQVFGNQYTVDRGEIRFLNPVRVEPSFDLDLTTRARGVTVNIALSGTTQRMNVNYSSDPPLQTSEIIALLAVGRDPNQIGSQAGAAQTTAATSAFASAGGNLLGQAASAQLNNRLQRFFGASRVKIDPTLTGVDNLTQARLTFEQQVSKDITITYITNLNRTTELLVRFQWDLSREWSAIAVRDQNGTFAVDLQFRKRFH